MTSWLDELEDGLSPAALRRWVRITGNNISSGVWSLPGYRFSV